MTVALRVDGVMRIGSGALALGDAAMINGTGRMESEGGLYLQGAPIRTPFTSGPIESTVATIAVPIAAWIWGERPLAITVTLMSIVVLIKHRPNIERLLAGQEPRIGSKT